MKKIKKDKKQYKKLSIYEKKIKKELRDSKIITLVSES